MSQFSDEDSDLRLRAFFDAKKWGVLDYGESIVLFKRGESRVDSEKLFELNPQDTLSSAAALLVSESLQLIDYKLKVQENNTFRSIQVDFFWKCVKPLQDDLAIAMFLVDKHNRVVYTRMREFCYGIFPTRRWKADEFVRDTYRILVPDSLAAGQYQVKCLLFSKSSGRIILFTDAQKKGLIDEDLGILLKKVDFPAPLLSKGSGRRS